MRACGRERELEDGSEEEDEKEEEEGRASWASKTIYLSI